jgi:hypothetical protein
VLAWFGEQSAGIDTDLVLASKTLKRNTEGFLKIEHLVKEAGHDVKKSCRNVVLAQDGLNGGIRHVNALERVVLRQTATKSFSPCLQALRNASKGLHKPRSIVCRGNIRFSTREKPNFLWFGEVLVFTSMEIRITG